MKYGVVFEDSPDGGVGAYVPDLPGVGVVGESTLDAAQLLDKAVQWHVEAIIDDGNPLPEPSSKPYDLYVEVEGSFVEHIDDRMSYFISARRSNGVPYVRLRVDSPVMSVSVESRVPTPA